MAKRIKKQTAKPRLIIPTQVGYEDLNKYPNLVIESCGSENLYFTHNNTQYYCKCLIGL